MRIFYPRSNTPDSAVPPSPTVPSPIETRHSDRSDPSPSTTDGSSPRLRPRVLTKPHRNSVFGSLRSLQSFDEEERFLTKSESKSSSLQGDAEVSARGLFGDHVKKAAEVQVTGTSVFRKRTQYVVLTESHLIRFKSQQKAAEMFPIIPSNNRVPLPRATMSSISSYSDIQTAAYADITQGVPLDEVVAVYKVEDGRPYFTIEISYLDERGKRGSALQLNLNGPKEAETWMAAIREHAALRRARHNCEYQQSTFD